MVRSILNPIAGAIMLAALAAVLPYTWGRGSDDVAEAAHVSPTVVATVPVPGAGSNLRLVGVNPNTDRIYVSRWTSAAVSVIDGSTDGVIASFGAAWAGAGVAVNPSTNRIYVSGWSEVTVHDGATNGLVAAINTSGPGGGAIAGGLAVNPNTNRIYVAAGHGSPNMIVIDGNTNAVVTTIPGFSGGSWGVDVNPNTNRIYASNSPTNDVKVIDGASNGVVATVGVGTSPTAVAVNPTTNRIYVANTASNNVSVIDGATNAVVATIPVGAAPAHGIAVNPDTNRIYVANSASNTVSVIDGATDVVVATLAVGSGPNGIGVNRNTDRIYVANWGSGTVSVIADSDSDGDGLLDPDDACPLLFGLPELNGCPAPGPPLAVGGITGLLEADSAQTPSSGTGSDNIGYIAAALAGIVGASLIAGGWYARRRWLR